MPKRIQRPAGFWDIARGSGGYLMAGPHLPEQRAVDTTDTRILGAVAELEN